MVVNRRDLPRLPADDHQLKVVVKLDEVASVALVGEEGVLMQRERAAGSDARDEPLPSRFHRGYMPQGASARPVRRA